MGLGSWLKQPARDVIVGCKADHSVKLLKAWCVCRAVALLWVDYLYSKHISIGNPICIETRNSHLCLNQCSCNHQNPNKSESCWIPSGCLNRRIELEYSSCMESLNLTEKRYLDGIFASRNDYDLYSIGWHQICTEPIKMSPIIPWHVIMLTLQETALWD